MLLHVASNSRLVGAAHVSRGDFSKLHGPLWPLHNSVRCLSEHVLHTDHRCLSRDAMDWQLRPTFMMAPIGARFLPPVCLHGRVASRRQTLEKDLRTLSSKPVARRAVKQRCRRSWILGLEICIANVSSSLLGRRKFSRLPPSRWKQQLAKKVCCSTVRSHCHSPPPGLPRACGGKGEQVHLDGGFGGCLAGLQSQASPGVCLHGVWPLQ